MIEHSPLEKARALVYGERARRYDKDGDDGFDSIAALWSIYLTRRLGCQVDLTRRDVGWLMSFLKGIRDAGSAADDNPVDGIGYLELGGRRTTAQPVALRAGFGESGITPE